MNRLLIMIRIRCVFKNNIVNKNVYRNSFSTSIIYRSKLSDPSSTNQSISDFYAGKSVFITGATGFVGRVLVERLLYTCKNLEKIYILIRPNGVSTQERLQELLQNPVFMKLKATRPQDLSKIVPIAGDVSQLKLGMNLDDEKTLVEKVSVVFHSAANVKFTAPLSDLMKDNYEGTKNVMELAKNLSKLDVFVNVSTVFRNSRVPVDEIPSTPPRQIDDVYKVLSYHSNHPHEIRKLLDECGNSYIFSKHMSEAYVANNHDDIPTTIVRPSLVASVYKEHLEGYTDSWMAGTSLLCDITSGLTRVVYGSKSVVVELIPVDYVCNFLIVAAAKSNRNTKCNVYNISTGHSNPINWGKLTDIYIETGKKNGYVVMPFPMVFFTNTYWAFHVLRFLTQVLPAFAADAWLRLTGRQPRYIKLQRKATSRAIWSRELTTSSWDVKTTRARELISTLNDEERRTFPCDPATIDWDKYVPIYCKGVKDYMLNDKNK